MIFNVRVDNNDLVEYAKKLEKLHKSAYPLVVKGTLNGLAFDVKKNTLQSSADTEFEKRRKNFFKANSRVEMATGWDVKRMVAEIGMVSSGLHNSSTNYAVKDLEQQEEGGKIDGRSFIPMRSARVGGSGVVKSQYRMDQLKDVINAKNVKSISGHSSLNILKSVRKQKLIRAAIKSSIIFGSNAYVLGNPNASGSQTLFKVSNFSKVGEKLDIKLIPLFSVKKDRKVAVTRTHFMEKAAVMSVKKVDIIYKENADRQFAKVLKK